MFENPRPSEGAVKAYVSVHSTYLGRDQGSDSKQGGRVAQRKEPTLSSSTLLRLTSTTNTSEQTLDFCRQPTTNCAAHLSTYLGLIERSICLPTSISTVHATILNALSTPCACDRATNSRCHHESGLVARPKARQPNLSNPKRTLWYKS